MKVYKSRKNKVSLTSEGVVRKEYTDKSSCKIEAAAISAMGGVYAPVLLCQEEDAIEIECIKGDLLLDRYLVATPEESANLAKMLSQTIAKIYKELNCITYDENFRNYIVTENTIFRIDYEEVTKGTLEQWCAKVCAFATLYDAPQETKLTFIWTLIDNLHIDKDILANEYKKELGFLASRWKNK